MFDTKYYDELLTKAKNLRPDRKIMISKKLGDREVEFGKLLELSEIAYNEKRLSFIQALDVVNNANKNTDPENQAFQKLTEKTLTQIREEAVKNLNETSDPFEKQMNQMMILAVDKTLKENPEIN